MKKNTYKACKRCINQSTGWCDVCHGKSIFKLYIEEDKKSYIKDK